MFLQYVALISQNSLVIISSIEFVLLIGCLFIKIGVFIGSDTFAMKELNLNEFGVYFYVRD